MRHAPHIKLGIVERHSCGDLHTSFSDDVKFIAAGIVFDYWTSQATQRSIKSGIGRKIIPRATCNPCEVFAPIFSGYLPSMCLVCIHFNMVRVYIYDMCFENYVNNDGEI